MTMFYAIEHRYGSDMVDPQGDHIGTVHCFPSLRERDQWTDLGNPYVNDRGHRSALLFRKLADRRAIISAARNGSMEIHRGAEAPT
jgi:hypothetical protein